MSGQIIPCRRRPAPPPAPLPDCGLRGRLSPGSSSRSCSSSGSAAGRPRPSCRAPSSRGPHRRRQQRQEGAAPARRRRRPDPRQERRPRRPGDVLIRLDDTQTRAALGVIVSQLVELTGRSAARGRARRRRGDRLPAGLRRDGPDAARVAEASGGCLRPSAPPTRARRSSSEAHRPARPGDRGDDAQREAKARELKLVREELARVRDMYKRNLTPVTRVLAMERDETRIAGEHGALIAQIARAGPRSARPSCRSSTSTRRARARRSASCARSRRASPSSPSAASPPRTSCAASSCARRSPGSCTSSACTRSAASSAPASR